MTTKPSPDSRSELHTVLLWIIGGLALFFLALPCVRMWVPEWRIEKIPEREFFLDRYRDLVTQAGFVPVPQSARAGLGSRMKDYNYIRSLLGGEASDWIVKQQRPLMVDISQLVDQGTDREAWLSVTFSLDGRPWSAIWAPRQLLGPGTDETSGGLRRPISQMVKELCIWKGDILHPIPGARLVTTRIDASSIGGGQLPQFTYSLAAGPASSCVRSVGTVQNARGEIDAISSGNFLRLWIIPSLSIFASASLFLLLAIRGRLSTANGLILGVLSVIVSFFMTSERGGNLVHVIAASVSAIYFAALLFFFWASGESLMRRSASGFFYRLDSLRQGRFHHPEARQCLVGFAIGAGLGGVRLILATIAVTTPGAHPESLSVSLYNWTDNRTAFIDVLLPLACVVLADGIKRSIPAVRSHLATVILAALLISLISPWAPSYFGFISAVPVAYVLAQTIWRQGILAALVASLVSILLPLAVFSLQSPSWLQGTLGVSVATLLMILAAGGVGWSRETKSGEEALRLFISYSREDKLLQKEMRAFLTQLEREGLIKIWYDESMIPGDSWSKEISRQLDNSDIVLLLVSPDSITSDHCQDEWKLALSLHEKGQARVIPVILRPSEWKVTPLAEVQVLPKDGRPVTTWPNRDEAFLDIAEGVRRAAQERLKEGEKISGAGV